MEAILVKRGDYGAINEHLEELILKKIKKLPITYRQCSSLRFQLLSEKSARRHHNLAKMMKTIYKMYQKGDSVVDIATELDFPPVAVFRTLLSAFGWSKENIKQAIKNPKLHLNEREQGEFALAEAADVVTRGDFEWISKCAQEFEDKVVDYFKQKGVLLKTQQELMREQKESIGSVVATPDILFIENIVINGCDVHWIDCKNFFGADVLLFKAKTKVQVKKYIDIWGSGAIIYKEGFCESLKIPNVVLLDATFLE